MRLGLMPSWTQPFILKLVDVGLVLALTYMLLLIIGERRTLWMVRGLIVLMLGAVVGKQLGLEFLSFVLDKLAIGSVLAMAVIFQADFRRFLELLGRGRITQLLSSSTQIVPNSDNVIDEIVDAVKELSQNRTGALMILETGEPIEESDFPVPGVKINAEISKELLQTIFQTSTLLHDGALLISGDRIMAAGIILPLSERTASRQLGTRHRAAMGITERLPNCICVVVSEETGSISLAEAGNLNRPLTSSKLKELLEQKFSPAVDQKVVNPGLRSLVLQLLKKGQALFRRVFRLSSSTSQKKL
ncbi:diadenylate cyclase CdaA [Merismopedia glauca]|uniref:Diadenylate cyclase n=1 Tax=Merismopedia glauca CCAP 1448/3 TaxID=1296344 RepID=A0A2T1C344_9CYAN|nr:diadenylate cyclase CdaA [Merismopedia glauca]PSB02682.1 TIGR00159 family protein [Merismopedia glauca CCAP 1448/3]